MMECVDCEKYINKRTKCPICGCGEAKVLFKQKFANIDGVTFIDEYTVVSCERCGFTFASGVPKQRDLDEYFKRSEKAASYEIYLDENKQEEFDKTWSFLKKQLLENHKNIKEISIVDIGCASGDFLFYLKENGIRRLFGIDPSQNCVDFMMEKRGIEAKRSTINEIASEEQFDVVKLTMVLEHIEDLVNTILKLKLLLKKDGCLFVTVPLVNQFYKSIKRPFKEFSVEHINYFTLKSLDNLMETCGFRRLKYNDREKPELGVEVIYHLEENPIEVYFEMESEAKELILQYVDICNEEEKEKNTRIESFVNDNRPIIIWGAGTFTQRQLASGQLGKCNIQAIVDKNHTYQGGNYKKIPVINPKQLEEYEGDIVISVYNNSGEIFKYIRDELKITDRKIIGLCENLD